MNDHDRSSRQLTAGLVDLAGTSAPDYRHDILRQVARTPQRPVWTFPERWIPMALVTQGRARSRSLTRLPRPTWQFIVVLALTLAMVAGLAIAGARLLLPAPPDRGFNSLVTVPVFEPDTDWDPAAIEGLLYPVAMDVGPDGNLYVVSAGTSEVLVVDPSGAVVRRWGERGTGDGHFDFQRRSEDADRRHRWGRRRPRRVRICRRHGERPDPAVPAGWHVRAAVGRFRIGGRHLSRAHRPRRWSR